MGPKSASKKETAKKQDKIIEDKTFGLKNKKGAKTQKYVKMVEQQVKLGGQNARKLERSQEPSRKDKQEEERQKLEELRELFKPVIAQPKASAQDPKSVLCAYFKQGLCTRGSKCKYSHDMNSAAGANERKSEKKNLYEDNRGDTMENWDEDELREVVEKRHGEIDKTKTKSGIVCKFFIDAVERKQYGWFWECPNGNDKCHYRHALPPGFVLKSEKKAKKDEDEITLEELIEKERANLPAEQTKITLESFTAWKDRKRDEKKLQLEESSNKKKDNFKEGIMKGLSGRDLFDFNPELIRADEDDEGGEVVLVEISEDEDEEESEADAARQQQLARRAADDSDNIDTGKENKGEAGQSSTTADELSSRMNTQASLNEN